MRLKILFFPLMLVVSISLVLIYGWPMFTELQNIKIAKNEAQVKLNEVRTKSENISKLNAEIAAGGDNVRLVYQYLPKEKKEESVIDAINYVALNTPGIVLSDLSLEKSDALPTAVDASGLPADLPGAITPDATSAQASGGAGNLDHLNVKIVVIGKYEELKVFFDRLDNMQINNTTKELTIEHVTEKTAAEGDEEAAPDEKNLLSATMNVDFGYKTLLAAKNPANAGGLMKDQFDFTPLEKMKEAAQIKIPELKAGGEAGRQNPFKL